MVCLSPINVETAEPIDQVKLFSFVRYKIVILKKSYKNKNNIEQQISHF